MIQEISAKKFRTLDDVTVKIPAVKTVNFVGPKGSGKSSLFEAVAVAYFGKGRTKNLQMMGQDENFTVGVKQTVANEKWQISRSDKKVGQSLVFDHNEKHYESKKITEAQEQFNNLFGCDIDVFMNTYYFQQGEADLLFTGTGGPRMELMRRIFNFDLFKKCFKDADARYKAAVKSIDEINGGISELKSRVLNAEAIADIKSQIAEAKKTYVKYQETIAVVNKKIASLPDESSNADAIRQSEQLDADINKMAAKLKDVNYDEHETRRALKELEAIGVVYTSDKDSEIESLENEIRMLKDSISDAKTSVNRAKRLLNDHESDLEKLIEQSGVCPTCGRDGYDQHTKRIPEIESMIERLKKDLSAMEKQVEKHSELLAASEKKHADLSTAKRLMRRIEYAGELSNKKQQREKYTDIISRYKSAKSERQKLQNEHDELSDEIAQAMRKEEQLKLQITQSDEAKKAIAERKEEITQINTEKRKYAILLEAFGNAGVPKYLFENVIPVWENKANEIISQLDDTHKVKIVSDDAAINFYAVSKFGDKEYADLSGGEKAIFTFSVRLALTYILIDLFGMKYRVIWLDEMFGAIDSKSREAVSKMIKMLAKDFEQIFIISHNEDSDIAEAVFRFSKDENGFTQIEAA